MGEKCFCHFNGYEVKDAKARKRIDALELYVTPQMYGAVADGVTDDTEAVQRAIAESANVLIPEGTYAIHGTIMLTGGKTVKMQNGAVFVKPASAENNDPVVWINGDHNSLIGCGMMNSMIKANVATPYGVLLIGDKGIEAEPCNATYNTICEIGCEGAVYGGNTEGTAIRVVYICCADGYQKAVFFNTLNNMYIAKGNDGIYIEGSANANIINNIQFRGVGSNKTLSGAAIHLKRASDRLYPLENIITNVFHHQSTNAISLFIDGGVIYNFIQNIACEQGGESAKGIVVSDDENKSTGNDISIIDNCSGGNTVSEYFYENNTVKRRAYSAVKNLRAVNFIRQNDKLKIQEKGFTISGVVDGSSVKLITIDTKGLIRGRSLTVDLDVKFSGPQLNAKLWGAFATEKYHIIGNASGSVSVKKISALSDYEMCNEPIVNGSKVTFSVKFPLYTGSASGCGIYCDYRISGESIAWTVTEHTTPETVSDPVRIGSCVMQTSENGETAARPSPAIKGQMYFDTTLKKPIWYNGTGWVDATGATV